MKELIQLTKELSTFKIDKKQVDTINWLIKMISIYILRLEAENNKLQSILNDVENPIVYTSYFRRALDILECLGIELYEIEKPYITFSDDFLKFIIQEKGRMRRKMTVFELKELDKLYQLYKFENMKKAENIEQLRELYKKLNDL